MLEHFNSFQLFEIQAQPVAFGNGRGLFVAKEDCSEGEKAPQPVDKLSILSLVCDNSMTVSKSSQSSSNWEDSQLQRISKRLKSDYLIM